MVKKGKRLQMRSAKNGLYRLERSSGDAAGDRCSTHMSKSVCLINQLRLLSTISRDTYALPF